MPMLEENDLVALEALESLLTQAPWGGDGNNDSARLESVLEQLFRTAVTNGRTREANVLIAHGARVDSTTPPWPTPLMATINHASTVGVLELLVDNGARILGEPAVIHQAVTKNHPPMLRRLLALGGGVMVNDPDPRTRETILQRARRYHRDRILQILWDESFVDLQPVSPTTTGDDAKTKT